MWTATARSTCWSGLIARTCRRFRISSLTRCYCSTTGKKDAHKNGWLLIRLHQPNTPNVFAVGAKITVKVGGRSSTRWILSGISFVSQSPYQQHLGLGPASQTDSVKITWPDGVVQDAGQLKTGEHTVTRDI